MPKRQMKLSKATHEEITSFIKHLVDIDRLSKQLKFQFLEDVIIEDFETLRHLNNNDAEDFISDLTSGIASFPFEKILWNCQTLLDNCADPELDYLDFSPKIKQAFALMDKTIALAKLAPITIYTGAQGTGKTTAINKKLEPLKEFDITTDYVSASWVEEYGISNPADVMVISDVSDKLELIMFNPLANLLRPKLIIETQQQVNLADFEDYNVEVIGCSLKDSEYIISSFYPYKNIKENANSK